MSSISVPTRDQVDQKSAAIFDQLEKGIGFLPNLYATIGYSSDTLERFLGFSGDAGKQTFNAKEIEAIKLAVSEVNGCAYCLAAHTAMAKMHGFSEEETFDLRTAASKDNRLRAITILAREVSANAGRASDAAREAFFREGFDQKALIDLVAVVTSVTFTNYAFGITEIPVDFPEAQPVSQTAQV